MATEKPIESFRLTGEALGKLSADASAFARLVESFEQQDSVTYRQILDRLDLWPHCHRICRWLCIHYCIRVCRIVCRQPEVVPFKPDEVASFAKLMGRLVQQPQVIKELVDAIDREDGKRFSAIVNEVGLAPYCRIVCFWICFVRCRLFCDLVCVRDTLPIPIDPVQKLVESGSALSALADNPRALEQAVTGFAANDVHAAREAIDIGGLFQRCHLICFWFCIWHCYRICYRICEPIPIHVPSIPELRKVAVSLAELAKNEDELHGLVEAFEAGEAERYRKILEKWRLHHVCHLFCHWHCHLHCYRRCILICTPPDCLSVFRYLGNYNYLTEVDSGPAGTGLTTDPASPDRAFYHVVRLNGVLCKKLNGNPAEYRFEVRPTGGGTWKPVLPSQIAKTRIGAWQRQVGAILQVKDYTVNGISGPDEVTIFPDPDGWIQVPQESSLTGPQGNFVPQGDLIRLDTRTIDPEPDVNILGITAGQSTAPAGATSDQHIAVRMRVREVGDPSTEYTAGMCQNMAVYNRRYDNVTHGGSWAPSIVSNRLGVVMVNVQEIVGGCAGVTSTLTVDYTAAHPNLGSFSLTMIGPGGPYAFTLNDDPGATPVNRYGHATPQGFSVSALADCAYIVKGSIQLLLTTGDSEPNPVHDEVAFCKVTPDEG